MSASRTFAPLPFDESSRRAAGIVEQMTLDEKLALVGGDRSFFIRPIPRLRTPEVYMTDATQGIHLRDTYNGADLAAYQPAKSTAFPCPLLLAATWDPALAQAYATAVGAECRAKNIGMLLGPGMNIYRHAQCGRNFEYLGEDPFLVARMVEAYVSGVQSTGTMATLKHFLCNNTDWFRRRSNSIVDERAIFEIYTPAFEAGIAAGARSVMTAYNLLNGEWCGESEYVIDRLLRKQFGFQWLVVSDWWAVYDGEKVARSGQDLEMPHAVALTNGKDLVHAGKVRVADLERMCRSILSAIFSMGLDEPRERDGVVDFDAHVRVALQTAREGIVLLENDGILPIRSGLGKILVTGPFVEKIAEGRGAARVTGFDNVTMLAALKAELGDRITHVESPTAEQLREAEVVLCNVGTSDSEGWDRPFALPDEQERLVARCLEGNPNTVVIVTSGSGVRMSDWSHRARALIWAFYGGQVGNVALAEILVGKTNPSGKLPMTIEKEFRDSPGYGYLPEGEALYEGFRDEEERQRKVWDLPYREGVFVGYRWYDGKGIEPLYPFGHGRSYTTFEYADLAVAPATFTAGQPVTVGFTITNTGKTSGDEIAQLYVEDEEARVPRPPRELKGFARVSLAPGESKKVTLTLDARAFSFWDPEAHAWALEPGRFRVRVGASSRDLRLDATVTAR